MGLNARHDCLAVRGLGQSRVCAGTQCRRSLESGTARLVLLCPEWKNWGTAKTLKRGTLILHSRADDAIPFADSRELIGHSGLPESALIEVVRDHRLADPAPLQMMLKACEGTIDNPPTPAIFVDGRLHS